MRTLIALVLFAGLTSLWATPERPYLQDEVAEWDRRLISLEMDKRFAGAARQKALAEVLPDLRARLGVIKHEAARLPNVPAQRQNSARQRIDRHLLELDQQYGKFYHAE